MTGRGLGHESHLQVHEDQIVLSLLCRLDCLTPVGTDIDILVSELEQNLERRYSSNGKRKEINCGLTFFPTATLTLESST